MTDSFDRIPDELKATAQWINWNYVQVDGKWTKVPINPNYGNMASVTDPSTWGTFADVVSNARNGWVNGGIGRVFAANDPYCGIDLDDPNGDAERLERGHAIIAKFNSYTEFSPSGRGAHIIIRATVPNGKRRDGVELYPAGRFFTFTGQSIHTPALPIADAQASATILWEELGGNRSHTGTHWDGPQTQSDDDLLAAAMRAANGQTFAQLFSGNWQGYPSQSEADLALTNILCFYTNNREQVHRLFLRSGLGQRDKARRPDYREYNISKGFDQKIALMDLSQLQQTQALAIDRKLASAPVVRPPVTLPHVEKPDGLLGEITQFIYDSAPRPVAEIALMGAIGLMCGIVGRAYLINGAGLNQYLLLLAETGRGKEAISSGMSQLINAVARPIGDTAQPTDIGFASAVKFIGPSEIASAPGLMKVLVDQPSMVSIIGEFGLKLRKWTGDRSNSTDQQIRSLLLDLYGKSGRGNVMREMAYSDKKDSTKAVNRPAYSILGESTATRFLDAIDESMISEGFLPRFLTIEYEGPRPQLNVHADSVMPSVELITKLRDLCASCLDAMIKDTFRNIVVEPDAQAFIDAFNAECDHIINTNRVGEVANQLWSRALLKLLKLAAVYAVGENYFAPVLQLKHARWAKVLIIRDIDRMIKRFERGETGSQVSDGKQQNEVMRVVAEFFRMDVEKLQRYGVTQDDINLRHIPLTYISRRLIATSAFRLDRLGATAAINKTLRMLCEEGRLKEYRRQGTNPIANKEGARFYMLEDLTILD